MNRTGVLVMMFLSLIACLRPAEVTAEKRAAVSPDGVEIVFSVEGTGEPALVFVHGWCADRSYWRHQTEEFSKTHTTVAIDLAGHGESGIERGAWTVEAFGGDVAAVVEALGLERVILVGHSMGGLVNIEAARRLPGRVIALVGADTYQDLERELPEQVRTQFINSFKADFAAATRAFVRGMFPADADSTLVERVAEDLSSAPAQVGIAAFESALAHKPAAALSGLEVPVYAINSDRFPTNVEANKRAAHLFEVNYMPGRGHFVMLEAPDEFNRLLGGVIEEIAGH